ncbi:MAG: ATP-binding protein [Chloroflexota bacterium]
MPRRVLLVEDNPGDARLIGEMLVEAQDTSLRLEWVDRLSRGEDRIAAGGVSAVLLDLSLPDSQGLETFRTLHARASGLPIVVLTGLDDEALGLQAIREGAQDYLVKGQVGGHRLIRALRYGIERNRQEEAQRFLAEASRTLASSLDTAATLDRVADLAVPTLADYCLVDLLQNGELRPVAGAHGDPDVGSRLLAIRRAHPPVASPSHPIWQVIRDGRPMTMQAASDSLLAEVGDDRQERAFLRRLQTASCTFVPLIARGRTIGVLTLAWVTDRQHPEEIDPWLGEEFGRRAALAIDNGQLFAQAHEASRLRDSVLSSVSHDLRNPLMVVKIIAETLAFQIQQLSLPDGLEMIEGLKRIDATTIKMTGLIDELLDVARMQAGGQVKLSQQRTELVGLLRGVVADYQARAPRYRIRTQLAMPTLTGLWDAGRLERVIGNLLANAIKYSRPESEIAVHLRTECAADGEWAVVEVEDHGVGIPAADLPRMFTWFHRGQNVIDHTDGSGIGLAGARQIVEQHGGTITVHSVEGRGATFRVRLPLAMPTADDDTPEVAP